MNLEVLPGRECGGCTVCCVHKPIQSDGLAKAPGIVCPNCTGSGCGVYEVRPTDCRQYQCAWKYSAWIPEGMRPDLSGILTDRSRRDAPQGYAEEVTFTAWRDPQDFARGPMPNLIASLIADGIAVHLSRPGPPGAIYSAGLVNEVFADAIRLRLPALFLERLKSVVQALDNHRWDMWTPKVGD